MASVKLDCRSIAGNVGVMWHKLNVQYFLHLNICIYLYIYINSLRNTSSNAMKFLNLVIEHGSFSVSAQRINSRNGPTIDYFGAMWSIMSSHHCSLSMKPTEIQLDIKLKEKCKKDPMGSIPPRKNVLAGQQFDHLISVCHHLIQARLLLLNKRPSCKFSSVRFVCEGQFKTKAILVHAYKYVQFMSVWWQKDRQTWNWMPWNK